MAFYREDIVNIELLGGSIHRSFLNHTIGSGDTKANWFGVRLFRDGEPVSAETATVTGLFIAPDGVKYLISETSFPGSTRKSGNEASVQLPGICYATKGQFCLSIKLSGSGVEGTMRIVDGMVSETGEDGAVVPTSTIPTTEDIIAAYEEAVAVMGGSVRFDTTQSLTSTEKATARENIDAAGIAQVVRIDDDQSLTDGQKATARANIDAAGSDELENDITEVRRDATDYQEVSIHAANETGSFVQSVTGFIDSSSNPAKFNATNQNARSVVVPCEPNKQYTVSKMASARFRIGFCDEFPKTNTVIDGLVESSTATKLTSTSSATSKYLVVFYYLATADTETESNIFNSLVMFGEFVSADDRYVREKMIFKKAQEVIRNDSFSGISVSDLEPNSIYAINYDVTDECITDLPHYGTSATLFIYEPNHPGVATKGWRCYLFAYGSVSKFSALMSFQYGNAGMSPWSVISDENGSVYSVSPFGPYTTIAAAAAAAPDGSTILIYPGTYNEAIDVRDKTLHFVGIDRDSVIVKGTSGNYNTPPFEISSGSIRNMTIIETGEGTHGTISTKAYCIHNDFPSNEDKTFILDNVRMINNCHACYGAGLRNGTTMIIRNCDILTTAEEGSTKRGALYCHTIASGESGQSKLILENNRIVSNTDYAIVLQIVGNSTVAMDCELIHNSCVADGSVSGSIIDNGNYSPLVFNDPQLTKNIISNGNNVAILNS